MARCVPTPPRSSRWAPPWPAGADTRIITARELDLPMYDPGRAALNHQARHLIDTVRRADAVVIATPGYHGGVSGLLKNALDYLQELVGDQRPCLHEIPVGCIVTAAGWQAGVTTPASLRSTVHALRGWPSPLGVVINSASPPFRENGEVVDGSVAIQLTACVQCHRRRPASYRLHRRRTGFSYVVHAPWPS